MDKENNIILARQGFERSFLESEYYNKQTTDDDHMELLINMLSPQNNDSILDLGTGSGYLAFPLAERYPDVNVFGLDIVEDTLERNKLKSNAMKLNNLQFRSYDGTVFPFENNSFDAILTRYALHHFPDLTHSIKEMYRILKDGGKVIISDPTPNENDYCGFVDRFMQMKPDGHIRFYDLNEYQEMMKEAGFSFVLNKMSQITFPREGANQYAGILQETDNDILSGYNIRINDQEIWISEKVLNMIFVK